MDGPLDEAGRLCGTRHHRAAQRAKIAKKVHKPPLGVNVINFDLNGFNASIWVPALESLRVQKTQEFNDRSIQIYKISVITT